MVLSSAIPAYPTLNLTSLHHIGMLTHWDDSCSSYTASVKSQNLTEVDITLYPASLLAPLAHLPSCTPSTKHYEFVSNLWQRIPAQVSMVLDMHFNR